MKITTLLAPLVFAASLLPPAPPAGRVTLNGWLSDKGCAAAKIKSGDITPNGTICVKKCLDEGAAPVFVDPKAAKMYEVTGYAAVKEDVGYYLEIDATIDAVSEKITIHSAKRLGDVIQMCGRKRK